MKLTELFLNRYLYRDNSQNLETKDSAFVSADSTPETPAAIPSGGAAQDINISNVYINGNQIEPGTIPQTVLDVSNWGWGQTCIFSSTNANTVSWSSGTFTSADGSSYAISSGNTGAMTGKNYIYLSLLDSLTVYQVTTVPANSVGIGKVLVAVAQNDAVSGVKATYNLSEATQIVGDNILANSINASKITTGQLIVGTNVGLGSAFAASSAGALATLNVVETAQLGTTVIVGGYIKTSLLSADNIQTGTLTVDPGASKVSGITVQSGGAITLNSVNSTSFSDIRFRNGSAGWDMRYIAGGGGGYTAGDFLVEPVANGQNFSIGSFPLTTIGINTNFSVFGTSNLYNINSRYINCYSVTPISDATYNCGSASNMWANVYAYNLSLSGGKYINVSGTNIQSNSDFRVAGSITLSGNMVFENNASITINGRSYFQTTGAYDPTKYYLRSA